MGAIGAMGASVRVRAWRSRVRAAVLDAVGAGARRRRQLSRAAARSRRPGARRARPRDLRHRVPQLPRRRSSRRRARRIESAAFAAGAERSRRRADAAGPSGVAQGPHVGRRPQRRRREGAGRLHSQRARAGARTGRAASRTAGRAQGARRRRRRRRAVFRREVRELSLGDGRSQGHRRAGSRTCSASESLDCRRTRRGRRPRRTRRGPALRLRR